jgi:glyoxylase I family protein
VIEFNRIHHVSIAVRDLEKARAFYSDTLKFQEIGRPPFRSRGIWYAVGNQQLHLIEYSNGQTLRSSGIDSTDGHFAIWVKSYNETIEYLEEVGIPFDARPNSVAGFAQIYILDIDNNVIEFDAEYES